MSPPPALVAEVQGQVDARRQRASEFMRSRSASIEVTPDTIITVLQYAIESVSLANVTGDERRQMTIELVRRAIVDAPIADEREQLLLTLVDGGIVGHIIDLVISAADGKLNTSAAASMTSLCCKSFGVGCLEKMLCCK